MKFDALIIGGSFAGLSAAMQLARARRRVCVVDAGAPRNRFAAASHGFFGQDGAAPLSMIANARDKLLAYPSVEHVCGTAIDARADGGGAFSVGLDSGRRLAASKLVLAFGVEDLLPDLPGVRERWGINVMTCPYCHGYEFGGQRQGVLNAAPMSSHQAQLVADWGPTTFFLDGRDDLDEPTRAKLEARGVAIEPRKLVALEGEPSGPAGVRLSDGHLVQVDAFYTATRTRMGSAVAEQLGCAFDEGLSGPVIRTDTFKLTTVPGVYAAGDIARFPPNATFASADGVAAGSGVHQALVFGA